MGHSYSNALRDEERPPAVVDEESPLIYGRSRAAPADAKPLAWPASREPEAPRPPETSTSWLFEEPGVAQEYPWLEVEESESDEKKGSRYPIFLACATPRGTLEGRGDAAAAARVA